MKAVRVFKTAWFAKAAAKARISDLALCRAFAQVLQGQVDDLGGGVYKKRLLNNQHRAILLTRLRQAWIYEYVFAKNDRNNIDDAELTGFRLLAKNYSALTADQLQALIANQQFQEICHDHPSQT